MEPDVTQESLHIKEIKAGLIELEQFVFDKEPSRGGRSGLLSLKIACDVFEGLCRSPLPIVYDIPRVKECCLHVAAAMDLVRYVKRIEDRSKLKKVKKHLALVGGGGFGVAATYTHQQSKPSRIQELIREAGVETLRPELLQDCSRKTIELMIGLAALNTFDEVFLEDPEESNSKDPNPDIIIRSTSENFGIACKSLNSLNRVNLRERIEEGLEQIDRAIACGKIDKRRGIVLLDISPLLNHDALYIPSKNRVWPLNHVPQILLETINDTLGKMLGAGPSSTLNETVGDLFKKHQAAPCVLVYAHTVMIASSVESTAPRYMKAMKLLFAGDHSKVKVFSERLNRALHCQ